MKKISQANAIKISIILIITVIFTILVLLLIKDNGDKTVEEEPKLSEDFAEVSDYQLYFFVSKNINNYITTVNKNAILGILDDSYITNNNITLENISNYSKYNNEDYEYKIKEIYSRNNDSYFTIYYLNGTIMDTYLNESVKDEIKFVVYIDYKNTTYSVIPVDDIDSVEDYKNPKGNLSVVSNEYNKYENINTIDRNQICMIYLSDYIMLNDNKKVEITTNIDDKKYFKEVTFNSVVKSCSYDNETRKYTVIDNNNNRYQFFEKHIMDYVVTISN